MEEQQNIQTQQAKEKKGLLKKIGAWFASPDGMQTLRFISAIVAVILVGVICALLGIYMDKDNFLPKERNYALIGACAVELALIFIIAEFFSMQKKLKKSETKGCIDPFTAAFMLGLNSYFLPDFVMRSYFPKSNVLYILLGILLCWLLYLIGAVISEATRLVLRSERHICHICFGTVLCHRVQGESCAVCRPCQHKVSQ